MEPRTAIFRLRVRDAMGAAPPHTGPATPLGEIVGLMVRAQASGVVIVDGDGRPLGIVPEHDIAR